MNRFLRSLNALSLRKRFLVAPLFGLALLGVLMTTFVYEAQRQNELLTRISSREFKAFELNAEVFTDLSAQHIALYELLSKADTSTGDERFAHAKGRLHAIHQAVDRIRP